MILISPILHTIRSLPSLPRRILHAAAAFGRDWLWHISTFSIVLLLYVLAGMLSRLSRGRFTPGVVRYSGHQIVRVLQPAMRLLNGKRTQSLDRSDIIDLALRNMLTKKSRAFVTVGGMALGIGAIVYLVSLGYGINQVVVQRVASLDELEQADVLPQTASQVKISDATLAQFADIPDLEKALPMIAVVAKIEYQNSHTDMAVYGVTADYLKHSAIQVSHGKIFDSNAVAAVVASNGQVAGVSTQVDAQDQSSIPGPEGDVIRQVQVNLYPQQWIRVRSRPSTGGEVVGYTQRVGATILAQEVWGGSYAVPSTPDRSNKWIHAELPVWKENTCPLDTGSNCPSHLPLLDDQGNQVIASGYAAQLSMDVIGVDDRSVGGAVLGITSDEELMLGEVLAESDSADSVLESVDDAWVEIASEAALAAGPTTRTVDISTVAKKEAVVNLAMLRVLGLTAEQAVGTAFSTSFQVVGNLLEDEEQLQSVPTPYTIIGVIPEDSTPFFYVPFLDLRSLGVANYSQVKVIADDPDALPQVRRLIESLGFSTTSVADTVEQIDQLFGTLRTVLAILGLVALAVAALGMFNTLTVSLLERTREVGLMKAMGMKSNEVRELFLTESMIMGFVGGILGIFLGFVGGKMTSAVLSLYSISHGQGLIDVAHIPASFVIVVFALSLIVGIFTGVYPARRATKISALDALRYE